MQLLNAHPQRARLDLELESTEHRRGVPCSLSAALAASGPWALYLKVSSFSQDLLRTCTVPALSNTERRKKTHLVSILEMLLFPAQVRKVPRPCCRMLAGAVKFFSVEFQGEKPRILVLWPIGMSSLSQQPS